MQRHGVTQKKGSVALWKAFSYDAVTVCSLALVYHENDYVFKWPDGTPFRPDFVTRHFSMRLRTNGLPHIRFHELRHSCASMLLNEGFSLKDIQAYMGHADITMTADLYGHLDVARKEMLSRNLANSIFQ